MPHAHDHSHHHHHGPHAHGAAGNEQRIGWAAVLTGAFMLAEAAGGIIAGSLALLADAGHMLADSASLALAWAAFRVARRPSDWQRTYGFHRFEVLAAFTNGLTLIFIALLIIYEALHRLHAPVGVLGTPMLVIAALGLGVNAAAFFALHGGERENLNVQGALLHVVGDLMGSAAAIIAALVILWTGWTPIDPLLSLLVAALILRAAWWLMRESGHVLLEGAPRGMDVRTLAADLKDAVAGVEDIHHVHAWSLTQGRPMITLHAKIAERDDAARIAAALKERLRSHHGISHATIEIECGPCLDEAIAHVQARHPPPK